MSNAHSAVSDSFILNNSDKYEKKDLTFKQTEEMGKNNHKTIVYTNAKITAGKNYIIKDKI